MNSKIKIKERFENIIKKAKEIHGDKYNYDKVIYRKLKDKVLIYCNTCKTYFLQSLEKHVNFKQNCSNCYNVKRYNLEKFIKEAKEIHGDKYDYSFVIYKNIDEKVNILCKKCNTIFLQSPYNHIKRKCNCTNCAKNKQLNTINFISNAKKIHCDKYDYSKTIYEKTCKNVIIICKKHGEFNQLPNNHLIKKCGCPKCDISHKKDIDEFIQKAIKFTNLNIFIIK